MQTGKTRFQHEKLDVYKVAIQFVAWAGHLLETDNLPRIAAVGQLDRASTSVPLNIAEGNGKRSNKDRCRYLDIARASALESAACLDVLVARRVMVAERVEEGKILLQRSVEMLFKMIERFSGS